MKDKQYMLVILDGIGLNEDETGNAVKLANTPNLDRLMAEYPNTQVKTSGLNVGLPDGQMGNSEVGHMSIGAGRVIYQDLTLISKKIETGEFFKNPALLDATDNVKKNGSNLHIFGLISDGGVHSTMEHIYSVIELAKREGLKQVYVHAFMDGRDTPPTSGVEYIRALENKFKELGIGKVATVMGRYYAMDRDQNYDRVEKAYFAITEGEGKKFKSAERAIENSYESQVFDEFILPIVIVDDEQEPIAKVSKNDSVIFANFRTDRPRELSHAFMDGSFSKFARKNGRIAGLKYVTMTEYDETLTNVKVAYGKEEIKDTLGDFLDKRGYSLFRIAETEKYAHVTFFFNGGQEKAYPNEKRVMIPSPKVATYDLQPEMSAVEITERILKEIDSKESDVIIVNYANGDMVGHTGVFPAAIIAVETVDECLGRIMDKLQSVGGEAIVTADHGNCEYMLDKVTGEAITSHSLFNVPFIVVSDRVKSVKEGALTDVSPTLLDLMGLNKPKLMTGESLIEKIKEENVLN